jgi:hypothetical protein
MNTAAQLELGHSWSENADKIRYIGFSASEAVTRPYARFFYPEMDSLPENVREALLTGPLSHELLPPVDHASESQVPGDWPVETGFTSGQDGSARVFVQSHTPSMTTSMRDWWFLWHGSSGQRYKLKHLRAYMPNVDHQESVS